MTVEKWFTPVTVESVEIRRFANRQRSVVTICEVAAVVGNGRRST
jgi:hypothetical protein